MYRHEAPLNLVVLFQFGPHQWCNESKTAVGAFFMGSAGQNRQFPAKAYMGVRETLCAPVEISPMHDSQRCSDLHLRPDPIKGQETFLVRLEVKPHVQTYGLLSLGPDKGDRERFARNNAKVCRCTPRDRTGYLGPRGNSRTRVRAYWPHNRLVRVYEFTNLAYAYLSASVPFLASTVSVRTLVGSLCGLPAGLKETGDFWQKSPCLTGKPETYVPFRGLGTTTGPI